MMYTRKPRCRSGCLTCRTRKIKCDENKPQCLKCTSTGRKCDEYLTPVPADVVLIKPKHHESLIIAPPLSLQPPSELRAIHFFRVQTASALSSTFKSDFWISTVLRLGTFDPMVRSSVIALGSLHEGFELASSTDQSGKGEILHHRRYALQHYGVATNQMQRHITSNEAQSPILLLVACMTLICLEILQDNYSAAIRHFEGGLHIIKTFYSEGQLPTNSLEENVRKQFAQLYVQALYLQDITYPVSLVPEMIPRSRSANFGSVVEAKEHIEVRSIHAYKFFWESSQPQASRQSITALYDAELSALFEWRQSFSELLTILGSNPTSKDLLGAELLNIHYNCLLTMLHLALPECVPQTLTPSFARILELIESLLQPSNNGQCLLPKYSFDIGVIGPLFHISIRAPNIHLREKAIGLLQHRNIPHREGMWGSSIAESMARGIMSLEIEVAKNIVKPLIGDDAVGQLEPESMLDETWFRLKDLAVDAKELQVSVGLKNTGPKHHALKEKVVTWVTW